MARVAANSHQGSSMVATRLFFEILGIPNFMGTRQVRLTAHNSSIWRADEVEVARGIEQYYHYHFPKPFELFSDGRRERLSIMHPGDAVNTPWAEGSPICSLLNFRIPSYTFSACAASSAAGTKNFMGRVYARNVTAPPQALPTRLVFHSLERFPQVNTLAFSC